MEKIEHNTRRSFLKLFSVGSLGLLLMSWLKPRSVLGLNESAIKEEKRPLPSMDLRPSQQSVKRNEKVS